MKKKRIMIICNYLLGLISFRKELLETLIERGYEIIIVAPSDEYLKIIIKMGCKYIPIIMESRGTNPFKDIKLYKRYKEIIKKEKPDIVLTYTIKPNIYAGYACSKLKIPYITNITGLGTSLETPSLLQRIVTLMYKKGIKKSKCVFFQNKENLNFMLAHKVVKGKYRLVPGSGVNLKHHTLLPYPKNKNIKFFYISRIMYEKGIDDYLNVAKYIKSRYSNVEFHILGKCDDIRYMKEIKNLEKKGIVIYHGQVRDVRRYQKISNCTIHPSFYPEGMSNVLLESCAAGRPIITTNRAGCKEIVENEINGYIFECKDIEKLKEIVEKFIKLPFSKKELMGINGRKKVEKEFSRDIVINAYLEEIEAIR